MNLRLHHKLALASLAMMLLSGPLYFYLIHLIYESNKQDALRKSFRELTNISIIANSNSAERLTVLTLIARLKREIPDITTRLDAYIINAEGLILDSPFEGLMSQVTRVDMLAVNRYLADPLHLVFGSDPRSMKQRANVFVLPVVYQREPAFLYLVSQHKGSKLFSSMGSTFVVPILMGSLVLLLSMGVLGNLIFRFLTTRLRLVNDVVENFNKNNFNEPINLISTKITKSSDCLESLQINVQKMSKRIVRQMKELRDADELRRQLIANVSHDLRTPLTSLQGYLQTLLIKRDVITAAQRQEYLEIAVLSSERLSTLIKDLFELSKLEATQSPPNSELFSLAELIQDVMQKFNLRAEAKQIRLKVLFPNQVFSVYAELGLIERVFENLIDNAMRFTGQGGEISIQLNEDRQRVRVVISDTGSGIPSDELPFIFDRFYQPEIKGGGKKRGAGLGLAIAKRVLHMHHSNIEAFSELGEGTSFVFSLPSKKLS